MTIPPKVTIMSNHPEVLYHGSLFEQEELMPGFRRTGKITRWDNTESNVFLYTTSDKDTAIELGFASAIEKLYNVTRFRSQGGTLLIEVDKPLIQEQLDKVVVYLYTIPYRKDHNWIKNDNAANGMTTEYKTRDDVHDIDSCVKVNIKEWLKNFKVVFTKQNKAGSVALEVLETQQKYSW